jgi:hypothetical protein
MKLDLKEIASSWFNVLSHSQEKKELANARFDICLECPSRKETFKNQKWAIRCGECGCPLKGKVYTDYTYKDPKGSCPLEKWKEVEDDFLNKIKSKKTLL